MVNRPVEIQGFPFKRYPLNNITPFSYRDGHTFLENIESVRRELADLLENDILQNTSINDFVIKVNETLADLMSKLVGYTIEVTEDQYVASMMDGTTFAAYTIEGIDKIIAAVNQSMNGKIDTVNQSMNGKIDTLRNDTATSLASIDATIVSNREVSESADRAINTAVSTLNETVGRINRVLGVAANTRFRTEYVAPTPSNPEYYVTFVYGAYKIPYAITKELGNKSSGAHTLLDMKTFVSKTGCNFVANASGWRANGDMMGLQILNGVVLHGWDTHITYDQQGRESLVVMRDGSWRIYDFNTDPNKIVEDGGWNSFTWGHALYKNGSTQDILSKPGYGVVSGRHLIGVTTDGVIAIISFPGKTGSSYGATGGQVLQALAGYNWEFLYFLDGGGSAQQYHEGFAMVHSTDNGGNRAVADVIGFNGSLTGKVAVVWNIISERLNGYSGGGISFLVEPDCIRIRVQSVLIKDAPRNEWSTLFMLPPWAAKPLYQTIDTAYLSSSYGFAVPVRIMNTGEVQASIPRDVDGAISFSADIPTERRFRDYVVE